MRYDKIAQGIVDVLSVLKDSASQPFFGIGRMYNGEFASPDFSAAEWNPGTTYFLVQPIGGQYKVTESNSRRDVYADPRIVIFVGSQRSKKGDTNQDVYERLDAIHRALHEASITSDGVVIGMTSLIDGSDALEFSLANHTCWALTVVFRTRIHIQNG